MLHIKPYGSIRVNDHDKSCNSANGNAAGQGSAGSNGKGTNPTGKGVRIQDGQGAGHFGASRDGGARTHQGLDFLANPGDRVVAPFAGVVTKADGRPYNKNKNKVPGSQSSEEYTIITISNNNGSESRLFYVNPSVSVWTNVEQGQTVGVTQDIAAKHNTDLDDNSPLLMDNHVHLQHKVNGRAVDPSLHVNVLPQSAQQQTNQLACP